MVRRDVSSPPTTQQSRAASQLQHSSEVDRHMPSDPRVKYRDTPRPQVLDRSPLPQFGWITLKCPGCHREISGPRLEERGVTCPYCNLGIPPDLISQSSSADPHVTDLLDMALADAEAETGTLQVLPSSGFIG